MRLLYAIIACVLLGITAGAAPSNNAPTGTGYELEYCELFLFLSTANDDLITS